MKWILVVWVLLPGTLGSTVVTSPQLYGSEQECKEVVARIVSGARQGLPSYPVRVDGWDCIADTASLPFPPEVPPELALPPPQPTGLVGWLAAWLAAWLT